MGFSALPARVSRRKALSEDTAGRTRQRVIADEPGRLPRRPWVAAVTSTWNGSCVSAPDGTSKSCLP